MTLLTCAALAILFSLSNKEILASTQNTLKKQLHESLKDIEWEDGSFDLDSDFYNLDGGVYLSLYTENGDFPCILIFPMGKSKPCPTPKNSGISMIFPIG